MKPAFPFSRRERRALTLIVFLIIIMRCGFALRPEEQIYTRPYGEDAFYLFSAAEHLARGEGFSVDGENPTNGIQPLIVVLYAPIFYLAEFDKLAVLRYTFGLIALIDALTALCLAFLVRAVIRTSSYVYSNSPLRSPPVIAAALWGFLYPVYMYTTSGLESGLVALLLVLSLLLYAKIHRMRRAGEQPSLKRWAGLGLVLGLTVLARIDTAMLVAAICLLEVYRYRARGIGHACIIGLIALLVSAPWWWYNYEFFGSILPQSGMAESLQIDLARNGWMALTVLTDAASVFFFLPKAVEVSHLISVIWFLVIFGALWLLHRKLGLFTTLQSQIHFYSLVPFILVCGGFFVFYIFFFGAPHFIPRYFQPFRILAIILAAVAIPHIHEQVINSKLGKRLFGMVMIVAFLFSFVRYGYAFMVEQPGEFYQVGKWALTVGPARVGMDQSGTAGYIARNVTNLDGKVNFEALQARLRNDIGLYVAREKLEYVADWEPFVKAITASAATHGASYTPVDTIGKVHIYQRIP